MRCESLSDVCRSGEHWWNVTKYIHSRTVLLEVLSIRMKDGMVRSRLITELLSTLLYFFIHLVILFQYMSGIFFSFLRVDIAELFQHENKSFFSRQAVIQSINPLQLNVRCDPSIHRLQDRPLLQNLHWHPVPHRVQYTVLLPTHKAPPPHKVFEAFWQTH